MLKSCIFYFRNSTKLSSLVWSSRLLPKALISTTSSWELTTTRQMATPSGRRPNHSWKLTKTGPPPLPSTRAVTAADCESPACTTEIRHAVVQLDVSSWKPREVYKIGVTSRYSVTSSPLFSSLSLSTNGKLRLITSNTMK